MSATATQVEVPDIGDFEDVPVIEILVSVGDTVAVEDPLVTLESDKATMDVPAPFAGVVKEITVSVGDRVAQGSVLMSIEDSDGAGDPGGGEPAEAAAAGDRSAEATTQPAESLEAPSEPAESAEAPSEPAESPRRPRGPENRAMSPRPRRRPRPQPGPTGVARSTPAHRRAGSPASSALICAR